MVLQAARRPAGSSWLSSTVTRARWSRLSPWSAPQRRPHEHLERHQRRDREARQPEQRTSSRPALDRRERQRLARLEGDPPEMDLAKLLEQRLDQVARAHRDAARGDQHVGAGQGVAHRLRQQRRRRRGRARTRRPRRRPRSRRRSARSGCCRGRTRPAAPPPAPPPRRRSPARRCAASGTPSRASARPSPASRSRPARAACRPAAPPGPASRPGPPPGRCRRAFGDVLIVDDAVALLGVLDHHHGVRARRQHAAGHDPHGRLAVQRADPRSGRPSAPGAPAAAAAPAAPRPRSRPRPSARPAADRRER